jgi:hypothetical protein
VVTDRKSVINNRTRTVYHLAFPDDPDVMVPVQWASRRKIIGHSHQYNLLEGGRAIELRRDEWPEELLRRYVGRPGIR